MGKVKAWLMEMDEDAQNMDEAEFVKKYGETYRHVWRNEQIWLESRKENRDKINPNYERGTIEVSDFIREYKLDYFEGNVVKYITRWRKKNGIEDLKKAQWYLNYLIKTQEN